MNQRWSVSVLIYKLVDVKVVIDASSNDIVLAVLINGLVKINIASFADNKLLLHF